MRADEIGALGIQAWLSLVAAEAAEAHAETFPERAADYGPALRGMLELGQRGSTAAAWRVPGRRGSPSAAGWRAASMPWTS